MTYTIERNPETRIYKLIKFILYKAISKIFNYNSVNQQISNKFLNCHIQSLDKDEIPKVNIIKYVQDCSTENYKISFRTIMKI